MSYHTALYFGQLRMLSKPVLKGNYVKKKKKIKREEVISRTNYYECIMHTKKSHVILNEELFFVPSKNCCSQPSSTELSPSIHMLPTAKKKNSGKCQFGFFPVIVFRTGKN